MGARFVVPWFSVRPERDLGVLETIADLGRALRPCDSAGLVDVTMVGTMAIRLESGVKISGPVCMKLSIVISRGPRWGLILNLC